MIVKVFLVDWDTNGYEFLKHIGISSKLLKYLRVRVFYDGPEIPPGLLPPQHELRGLKKTRKVLHFSEVHWGELYTQLFGFNGQNIASSIVYIVSQKPQQFDVFLKLSSETGLRCKFIQDPSSSLLDVFDLTCTSCRLIFADFKELGEHEDHKHHEQHCAHPLCLRRPIDSPSKSAEQNRCQECLKNRFTTYHSDRSRKSEMESLHSSQWLGNLPECWSAHDTQQFSDHFLFSYSSIPCASGRGCPAVFTSVQDQAHHHLTAHGMTNPYYCMVCHRIDKVVCFEEMSELLMHGKLEGHCEPDFVFP